MTTCSLDRSLMIFTSISSKRRSTFRPCANGFASQCTVYRHTTSSEQSGAEASLSLLSLDYNDFLVVFSSTIYKVPDRVKPKLGLRFYTVDKVILGLGGLSC